jgi:hypothetical protein
VSVEVKSNRDSILKLKVEAMSTDVTYGVKLRLSKPTVIVEVKS